MGARVVRSENTELARVAIANELADCHSFGIHVLEHQADRIIDRLALAGLVLVGNVTPI